MRTDLCRKITEILNNQILQELLEENKRPKENAANHEKLVERALLKMSDDMKR